MVNSYNRILDNDARETKAIKMPSRAERIREDVRDESFSAILNKNAWPPKDRAGICQNRESKCLRRSLKELYLRNNNSCSIDFDKISSSLSASIPNLRY